MKITTLDRYLSGQLIQVVLFGLLMFTVIWLAPETLFKLTHFLFAGKISFSQYLLMIAYDLPKTFQNSIPMSVLFGSIFLFRRLSLNLELITLFGNGIRPLRLMVPMMMVGVLFTVFHWVMQEVVTPYTAPIYDQMQQDVGLKSRHHANFTFVEKNRQNRWDKFLLIGGIHDFPKQLTDFLILYYKTDPQSGLYISRILRAAHGQWNESAKAWQLFDGTAYELDEEGVYRENRPFTEQWVTMSRYPYQLLQFSLKNPMDMDYGSLYRYMSLLEEGGQRQEISFYQVRMHQKIALPLASICFAVLGAFLGMERIRSRHHYALTFGALLLFLYSIAVPFATNLGSLELLPTWLVAWLPLTVAIGFTWLMIQIRKQVEGV